MDESGPVTHDGKDEENQRNLSYTEAKQDHRRAFLKDPETETQSRFLFAWGWDGNGDRGKVLNALELGVSF